MGSPARPLTTPIFEPVPLISVLPVQYCAGAGIAEFPATPQVAWASTSDMNSVSDWQDGNEVRAGALLRWHGTQRSMCGAETKRLLAEYADGDGKSFFQASDGTLIHDS